MSDPNRAARAARAWASLTGLSVGDALGSQYFRPGARPGDLHLGIVPHPPWQWTDDTEMACSIVAMLVTHDRIVQDELALDFAERCEPYRGYGPGAVEVLRSIRDGRPWRAAAGAMFGGQGSCGNGSAMRVAPLGAYLADAPERVAVEAVRSAEVTHCHPQGLAGAAAVALAAAGVATGVPASALIDRVLDQLPAGAVRAGIERAGKLGAAVGPVEAASELGNGARVLCQDTVPFCLWVAARFRDDYRAAVAACVTAGGDVDTTCAIVGGIVAAAGADGVPEQWLVAREALPAWLG